MPQTNLIRLLNSVGKSTFVRYYHEFADASLSNQQIVELLPREYTITARHTRASKARRIISEALSEEALEIILHSEKVDDATRTGARQLLEEIRRR